MKFPARVSKGCAQSGTIEPRRSARPIRARGERFTPLPLRRACIRPTKIGGSMTLTIILRADNEGQASEGPAYTTIRREDVPKETVLEIVDGFRRRITETAERHAARTYASGGRTEEIALDYDQVVLIYAESAALSDETDRDRRALHPAPVT